MDGDREEQRRIREVQIWDSGALQRTRYEMMLAHANAGPARMRRDLFIKEAVAHLGDKKVLEIGSQGWGAVLCKFHIRPKSLICINISETELDKGKLAAEHENFPAEFKIMDANHLDFPDEYFDFVYGVAILHHLDFTTAMREVARVTKPGGRILFVEPLRLNPVARLVRRLTPAARTPDERPLGREELKTIDTWFNTNHLYTELFYTPMAVISPMIFANPNNWLTRKFDDLDRILVNKFPRLGIFYRTVTIYGCRLAEDYRS